MPPLTRQRTLESVLSWWSDSNLIGPNLDLHAAAKPLMRLLYHRAVLKFIANPRDVLTRDDVDIYCSYLAYDPSLRWCQFSLTSLIDTILEGVQTALPNKVVDILKGFGGAVFRNNAFWQEMNAITLVEEILEMVILNTRKKTGALPKRGPNNATRWVSCPGLAQEQGAQHPRTRQTNSELGRGKEVEFQLLGIRK
ncbi:hypothetical protein C8R45DRAFT_945197 [Mycena sanguinolenta]|nr:hypothetical protein C8R45DRAFT_945197 [Mycena sanguinolenta]